MRSCTTPTTANSSLASAVGLKLPLSAPLFQSCFLLPSARQTTMDPILLHPPPTREKVLVPFTRPPLVVEKLLHQQTKLLPPVSHSTTPLPLPPKKRTRSSIVVAAQEVLPAAKLDSNKKRKGDERSVPSCLALGLRPGCVKPIDTSTGGGKTTFPIFVMRGKDRYVMAIHPCAFVDGRWKVKLTLRTKRTLLAHSFQKRPQRILERTHHYDSLAFVRASSKPDDTTRYITCAAFPDSVRDRRIETTLHFAKPNSGSKDLKTIVLVLDFLPIEPLSDAFVLEV